MFSAPSVLRFLPFQWWKGTLGGKEEIDQHVLKETFRGLLPAVSGRYSAQIKNPLGLSAV